MDREVIQSSLKIITDKFSLLTIEEKIITVANYLLQLSTENLPIDVDKNNIGNGKYINFELLKYPENTYLKLSQYAHYLISIANKERDFE